MDVVAQYIRSDDNELIVGNSRILYNNAIEIRDRLLLKGIPAQIYIVFSQFLGEHEYIFNGFFSKGDNTV